MPAVLETCRRPKRNGTPCSHQQPEVGCCIASVAVVDAQPGLDKQRNHGLPAAEQLSWNQCWWSSRTQRPFSARGESKTDGLYSPQHQNMTTEIHSTCFQPGRREASSRRTDITPRTPKIMIIGPREDLSIPPIMPGLLRGLSPKGVW